MKIQVKLAPCCKPFMFNLDGETVIFCHKDNMDKAVDWENTGDIRVMEYPLELPDNKLIAHRKLTSYLKDVGEDQEGYSLGAFFNLKTVEG